MGNSRRPPIRKPSMAPPGPPRDSQSSIRTTQPTPIIVPKPKVKYSIVLRFPCSRSRGPRLALILCLSGSTDERLARDKPSVLQPEKDGRSAFPRNDDEEVVEIGVADRHWRRDVERAQQ